jgi:hypothetical protein
VISDNSCGAGLLFSPAGHLSARAKDWRVQGQARLAHSSRRGQSSASLECPGTTHTDPQLHDAIPFRKQCSVAVLAALGARASPHSQLLGIDTVCLADGTPSPPMFLYAGERREMACRQLESRARELCWSHGFFEHVKIEHLDSTVGLVQLLICESSKNFSRKDEVQPCRLMKCDWRCCLQTRRLCPSRVDSLLDRLWGSTLTSATRTWSKGSGLRKIRGSDPAQLSLCVPSPPLERCSSKKKKKRWTLIAVPLLVAACRRHHRRGVQPSVLHLDDRIRSVCHHRRRPDSRLSRNRTPNRTRADSRTAGDDGEARRRHVDRYALGCGVSPPICATHYRYVS